VESILMNFKKFFKALWEAIFGGGATPTPPPVIPPPVEPPPPPVTPPPVDQSLAFGYYFQRGDRFGDFPQADAWTNCERADLWSQTRSSDDSFDVLIERFKAMLTRIPTNRRIWVGVGFLDPKENTCLTQEKTATFLETLREVWDRVVAIELYDETDKGKDGVSADVALFRSILSQMRLSNRPLTITFTSDAIYHGDGWQAPDLDIIALESYVNTNEQNADDPVAKGAPMVLFQKQVDTIKAVRPAAHIWGVIMSYGRNFAPDGGLGWRDMRTLCLHNQGALEWTLARARDFKDLDGIFMFSAGRATGTFDDKHPEIGDALIPTHKRAFERIHNPLLAWPAPPADMRPGPIVRISLESQCMYPWGTYNPKPVPYPSNGGWIRLKVHAFDAKRELTTDEMFAKDVWHRLSWVATCGNNVEIKATPLGAKPWYSIQNAPWGEFTSSDLTEVKQVIKVAQATTGSTIRVTATLGDMSAAVETLAVQ
jgi:hypothetical protein